MNARAFTLLWNHHPNVLRALGPSPSSAFPRLLSGARGGVCSGLDRADDGFSATPATTFGRSVGGVASDRAGTGLAAAPTGAPSCADSAAPMKGL